MTDRAEFREERKLKLDYWKTIISLGGLGDSSSALTNTRSPWLDIRNYSTSYKF
jgi:hypothetical protein